MNHDDQQTLMGNVAPVVAPHVRGERDGAEQEELRRRVVVGAASRRRGLRRRRAGPSSRTTKPRGPGRQAACGPGSHQALKR